MDSNEEPIVYEEEEVHIDDNVDQLFEQKMRKLRDLGLYDDRMMDKVNLINDMTYDPNYKPVVRGQIKRSYQVLGRPDFQSQSLVQFEGEVDDGIGSQKFKPIESGLKWSLPITKRPRNEYDRNRPRDRDNDRDRDRQRRDKDRYGDRERDVKPESELSGDGFKYESKKELTHENCNSNEAIDRKTTYNDSDIYQPSTSERADTTVKEEPNKRVRFDSVNKKPSNFNNFFESRRPKPEEKTETITDIEAFIRDCNKKAEKPKPLLLDDIDDCIQNFENKYKQIFANLDKTYSS